MWPVEIWKFYPLICQFTQKFGLANDIHDNYAIFTSTTFQPEVGYCV